MIDVFTRKDKSNDFAGGRYQIDKDGKLINVTTNGLWV
jgi:hypothetical protein